MKHKTLLAGNCPKERCVYAGTSVPGGTRKNEITKG